MPLTFNTLLREAGIPPANVRLLRHKDHRAEKGRSIYELWRDDRPQFEIYQSIQGFPGRKKLKVPYWVSFVGTPTDETLFVGIYAVEYLGLLEQDSLMPHNDNVLKAGSAAQRQCAEGGQCRCLQPDFGRTLQRLGRQALC